MRNKSLFLLIACVCGTIAAIGVSQWMQAQDKGQSGAETVEILVAAVNIDKGEEITAEKMRLEQWPEGKAPEGSSSEFETVLGKFAKTQFYAGEPLMALKLTDSSHEVIPKGYSVVDMNARDVGIAHVIQPGDHVNVMAYFNKSESIPRPMTKTVLMGVRVYALDGDTERKVGDDRPTNVRSIQLLIHKNDGEAWTYANELGKIRLAVGNESDFTANTAADGTNLAGVEFLGWLEDQRPSAPEPAPPAITRQPQPIAEPQPTRSKDGFEILKIVEGRMIKYWIEPGKLPVVIEDTGLEANGIPANTGSNGGSSDTFRPVGDDRDEDYGYLNGEQSPFYQPPGASRTPGSDF